MLNEVQRQLVTDNLGLVYSCAKKKHLLNDEDSVQYGFLGLCKAAERFDLNKGIRFSTFATNYIIHWLDGLYSDIKYRNNLNNGTIVISDDYEEEIIARDEIYNKILTNSIINSSDAESQKILKLIYQGYSSKEICNKLGITSSKYYGRLNKIKERLRYER